MNNGNVNNNTKSNTNYVRAVSDYHQWSEDPPVSFAGILEAYYDCRRQKRGTSNEQYFETHAIKNCLELWHEVCDRSYEIGRSICFVIDCPLKREVFAASFRDRVIHHWLHLRIFPLIEEYLYPCMKSNRKGKGTADAIHEAYEDIRLCSEDYTKSCWIYKFDLKGFFMSIDKRILRDRLLAFVQERYHGEDKDTVLWLLEKTIMHCPQNRCYLRCEPKEWDGLAPNKSLFTQDENHGIAIGNLTSQMFANFLLRDIVHYLYSRGFKYVIQYVDDFIVIDPSREKILSEIPALRDFISEDLHATLHPHKQYVQHYTKGVTFVGGIIKPHRFYTSKRTIRKANIAFHNYGYFGLDERYRRMHREEFLCRVNSYLGFMQHHTEFLKRQELGQLVLKSWGPEFYFTGKWYSARLKKRFKKKYKLMRKISQHK